MIDLAIAGATTICFTSSLLFARWVIRRFDQSLETPESPEEWIEAYSYPSIDQPCPFCGVAGRDTGPTRPVSCTSGPECPGYPKAHLHVQCDYCKAKWMRAARVIGNK